MIIYGYFNMKTAIYVADGVAQLVITPETDFEKRAVTQFTDMPLSVKILKGSFYECLGDYVRQGSDQSLILRVDDEPS